MKTVIYHEKYKVVLSDEQIKDVPMLFDVYMKMSGSYRTIAYGRSISRVIDIIGLNIKTS